VPELDPGGEETVLEDAPTPAPGGEEEVAAESEPVEAEPEIGPEAPSPGEVTGAATEAVVEEPPAEPVHTPEVDASPAGPQYAPQQEIAAEPVENRPLPAPTRADRPATVPDAATEPPAGEGVESHTASAEPSSDAPDPAPTSSGDPAASLAGKRSYVVRPGDCLTYIAEALLAAGASQSEIEDAVDRLWRLNEDRIGTGDPDVIYPGTVLRLR
jgi:outer membrane biosynthesis protein TonB